MATEAAELSAKLSAKASAELSAELSAKRRADGATLVCLFVLALMIIPARLVVRGIPFSLTPANLVSLVAGLCWLCAQLTTTLGVAKGRTPVRTAVFVYVIAVLITYGYANSGYLPSDERNFADHALVLALALGGLALAICDGVRGADRLDFILKTVVVAGAIIGVVGACQFILKLDLTGYLALPGLRYTSVDSAVLIRGTQNRVAATTGHPIEFGVVCSMVLPLAAHYGFQARERAEPALRWWLCAGLIGMGLMFSVSRSAILALVAVGFVLFLGWSGRRRVQMLIVIVAFLGLVKLTSPGLIGTFYNLFANASSDSSISYRTHDYAVAGREIAKHFWFGRGAGTWYAPKHEVFDNQYILSAVETGVIGIVTIVAMFVYAIYSAARARYLSTDRGIRDLGLTLAACLMAPLVGATTFDLLSFATVTGLSFLLIGASGSLLRTATERAAQEWPHRRPVSRSLTRWRIGTLKHRWRKGRVRQA